MAIDSSNACASIGAFACHDLRSFLWSRQSADGFYLLAQKRFEEARDCYLRALEIDPDYSIARKRLADVERVIAIQDEDPGEQTPPAEAS